jgi:hypothetical protein
MLAGSRRETLGEPDADALGGAPGCLAFTIDVGPGVEGFELPQLLDRRAFEA